MRYTHFSRAERLELSILLKKGYSIRAIAEAMKRSPSSVSRELKRNRVNGEYIASKAMHKARVKRKYSKYQGMKIRQSPELEKYVRSRLARKWSPEQIAGRLKLKNGSLAVISHRVIYKYIYSIYGWELTKYLKHKGSNRKNGNRTKYRRIALKNRIFIDQRPKSINGRLRYGDFEGDTLGVPKYTRQTLAALVDRKSRYLMVKKISRLKYAMKGFKELIESVKAKSVTLDNGFENNSYKDLDLPTYFCHPYASWEKGSIENIFSIVREYIPKKKPLAGYSEEFISAMVEEINNTPRKCLNYRTPRELFEKYQLTKCCT